MVPPDSRAILIGVSRYDDPESFPELQAAANSLRAMRALLTDPGLCGWRPEQITTIPNPRSRAEVEELLSDAAERTTGVLLVYYVGHGILSPRLELCLTVASTRPTRPKITGLPWESVAEILDARNCPARARIAMLDCCYAGQVITESLGSSAAAADAIAAAGVYTLTATIRNKTAHVVPADQQDLACTSFTGELCDLVREESPAGASG
jgi:Caspase domain